MKKLLLGILAGLLVGSGASYAALANTSVPDASLRGSHGVKNRSVGHLSLKNSIITCEKLAPDLRARVCGPRLPALPGPAGPPGPAGAPGPAGPTGPAGATAVCKPLHTDPL